MWLTKREYTVCLFIGYGVLYWFVFRRSRCLLLKLYFTVRYCLTEKSMVIVLFLEIFYRILIRPVHTAGRYLIFTDLYEKNISIYGYLFLSLSHRFSYVVYLYSSFDWFRYCKHTVAVYVLLRPYHNIICHATLFYIIIILYASSQAVADSAAASAGSGR